MSFPTGRDRRGCAFASTARRLTSPGAGRKRRATAARLSGLTQTGAQRGKGNGIAPRTQADLFGEIGGKKRRQRARGIARPRPAAPERPRGSRPRAGRRGGGPGGGRYSGDELSPT